MYLPGYESRYLGDTNEVPSSMGDVLALSKVASQSQERRRTLDSAKEN